MKPTYKEIERQLSESRREFWAADATINNLEMKLAGMAARIDNAEKLIDTLRQDKDKVIDMSIERVNKLLSRAETTATDAFLAEVRAQGVEMAMEHMQSSGSLTFGDCYISLNEFADQLRKGGNQ